MPTQTALPVPRLIDLDGLGALYRALVTDSYHVIGPRPARSVPRFPPPGCRR